MKLRPIHKNELPPRSEYDRILLEFVNSGLDAAEVIELNAPKVALVGFRNAAGRDDAFSDVAIRISDKRVYLFRRSVIYKQKQKRK